VTFLQTVMDRMKLSKQDRPSAGEEAKVIFICEMAQHHLELAQLDKTRDQMREAEKMLETLDEPNDLTNSFYYKLTAAYQKVHIVSSLCLLCLLTTPPPAVQSKENPADFYRATLQFLTYTPVDTLSSTEQCEIARDLCLAAFVSETIFTFGELVMHLPFLDATQPALTLSILRRFSIKF
jgi:26S proteasome regulatory subunit N9